MGDKIILNLDESGNLGRMGKYFTIACVETDNNKPLNNVMKKAILKTKLAYPQFKDHQEIKASDSNVVIKDYFIRKILSKENVSVRYIVADKEHVKPQLLEDENLLYNYMLHFLILPVARKKNLKELVINIDKRSIKVKSAKSFEDYIILKLNYELGLDIKITVTYFESHNSYAIQAADFLANAINSKYEYGIDTYYNLIKNKVVRADHFPKGSFGQSKVVNL